MLWHPCPGLLAQLELAPQTEQLLLSADFSMGSLGAGVDAGWELHDHLEALKVRSLTGGSPDATDSVAVSVFLCSCLNTLGVSAGEGSRH